MASQEDPSLPPNCSEEEFYKIYLKFMNDVHREVNLEDMPLVGGEQLNIYRLYDEVSRRGGLDVVIDEKLWKDVVADLRIRPSLTSASFSLRAHYATYLLQFEHRYLHKKPMIDPWVRNAPSPDYGRKPRGGWQCREIPKSWTSGEKIPPPPIPKVLPPMASSPLPARPPSPMGGGNSITLPSRRAMTRLSRSLGVGPHPESTTTSTSLVFSSQSSKRKVEVDPHVYTVSDAIMDLYSTRTDDIVHALNSLGKSSFIFSDEVLFQRAPSFAVVSFSSSSSSSSSKTVVRKYCTLASSLLESLLHVLKHAIAGLIAIAPPSEFGGSSVKSPPLWNPIAVHPDVMMSIMFTSDGLMVDAVEIVLSVLHILRNLCSYDEEKAASLTEDENIAEANATTIKTQLEELRKNSFPALLAKSSSFMSVLISLVLVNEHSGGGVLQLGPILSAVNDRDDIATEIRIGALEVIEMLVDGNFLLVQNVGEKGIENEMHDMTNTSSPISINPEDVNSFVFELILSICDSVADNVSDGEIEFASIAANILARVAILRDASIFWAPFEQFLLSCTEISRFENKEENGDLMTFHLSVTGHRLPNGRSILSVQLGDDDDDISVVENSDSVSCVFSNETDFFASILRRICSFDIPTNVFLKFIGLAQALIDTFCKKDSEKSNHPQFEGFMMGSDSEMADNGDNGDDSKEVLLLRVFADPVWGPRSLIDSYFLIHKELDDAVRRYQRLISAPPVQQKPRAHQPTTGSNTPIIKPAVERAVVNKYLSRVDVLSSCVVRLAQFILSGVESVSTRPLFLNHLHRIQTAACIPETYLVIQRGLRNDIGGDWISGGSYMSKCVVLLMGYDEYNHKNDLGATEMSVDTIV